MVILRQHPRHNSCVVTQLWGLGTELEHKSLTCCGARSSGQRTVDNKSSSIRPAGRVQLRLHGRDASVQYGNTQMSEADIAQGQNAVPHILRCFETTSQISKPDNAGPISAPSMHHGNPQVPRELQLYAVASCVDLKIANARSGALSASASASVSLMIVGPAGAQKLRHSFAAIDL